MNWKHHATTAVVVLGFAALIAIGLALALVSLSVSPEDPPSSNRTSWTDDHGRLCTQVDPPGEAIAIDCDFPPSTITGG